MPIRRDIPRSTLGGVVVRFRGQTYTAEMRGRRVVVGGGRPVTWARPSTDDAVSITRGTRVDQYLVRVPPEERDEAVAAGLIVSALVGLPRESTKRHQMFVWTDHIALARGEDPEGAREVSFVSDPVAEHVRALKGQFEIVRRSTRGARGPAEPPRVVARRVPVEPNRTRETTRSAAEEQKVQLRERQLVEDFCEHLRTQGHDVGSYEFDLPQGNRPLRADIFDFSAKHLIEAKGSSAREDVRMAIGQLLDYRSLLFQARELPRGATRLSVLLPEPPPPGLLEVLHSVQIGGIWRRGSAFESKPAPQ